jgi:predicted transport protein
MTSLSYTKPVRLSLKDHPEFSERWLQERLADDPALLGLGDLVLKDKERLQARAGRLDLLLQDPDSNRRYEVEIQLGKTDEAHIIRTIEYWDIERKRYPQYDHAAVIVAEEITGRFLNVISLFNGAIPLVAIQLTALQLGNHVSLVCTKVLDEIQLGLVDDDEEVQVVTNRSYWEERGTKETLAATDELFGIVKSLDPDLELKYNKYYIGLAKNDHSNNFVAFCPKKEWVRIELRLPRSDELQRRLDDAGLDVMDYDARWGKYRIRLGRADLEKHRDLLAELFKQAYAEP